MPTVTLANSQTFQCNADQTLLEAATTQGISLEYSCRTGRCGVCKARVVSGTTQLARVDYILSEAEISDGYILTCCNTALSDIKIDIEDLSGLGLLEAKIIPIRIEKLLMLSADVIEVTLRTPPKSRLSYLPGQYIQVIAGNGLRRSYSLANAPRQDGSISIQIRKFQNGKMSRYWFEEAQVNDLLRLEGPLGTFFLRESNASNLILLATGTGIAPIKAFLEELAATPQKNTYRAIHVYWGGRTEKDHYWSPNLSEIKARFTPLVSRSSNGGIFQGYVQDAVLRDDINLPDSVVYACGSEFMINSARKALINAGLPAKCFYSDAFVISN